MPYGPEDVPQAEELRMEQIVMVLASRFGRMPTEDEIEQFIMADDKTREEIWNKELKDE